MDAACALKALRGLLSGKEEERLHSNCRDGGNPQLIVPITYICTFTVQFPD
jgi:hypothetical protein